MSQVYRVTLQLVALLVLARLLDPKDFGLAAMAATVIALFSLLRDVGSASYLIHRPVATDQAASTTFWVNAALAIVLAVGTFVAAPWVAEIMREPRLTGVIRLLSVSFPLLALGSTHQALTERAMRFRFMAIVEMLASTVALIAAVVLAALVNAGVYSLIAQHLVILAVTTIGLWLGASWRPRLLLNLDDLRGSLKFGGNLAGFTFANFFARNSDSMLIGRFLGAHDVGIYGLAYKVMLFPVQNLSWVLNRALLPEYSRLQTDLPKLAELYRTTLIAITAITVPIICIVWVLRESVVALAFGARWAPAADIIAILAPIGVVQALYSTVGSVYLALGRTDLMMRRGVVCAAMIVLGLALGLTHGLRGLAIGYLMANLIVLVVWERGIVRLLGALDSGFIRTIATLIGAGIIAGGTIAGTEVGLSALGVGVPASSGVAALIGFAVYASLVRLLCWHSVQQVIDLARQGVAPPSALC